MGSDAFGATRPSIHLVKIDRRAEGWPLLIGMDDYLYSLLSR